MRTIFVMLAVLFSQLCSAEPAKLTSLCGFDFDLVTPDELFHEPTALKRLGHGMSTEPLFHTYHIKDGGYLELSFIENDSWLHQVRIGKEPSKPVHGEKRLNRNCATREGLRIGDSIRKARALYGSGDAEDSALWYHYDEFEIEARIYFKNEKIIAIEVGSTAP